MKVYIKFISIIFFKSLFYVLLIMTCLVLEIYKRFIVPIYIPVVSIIALMLIILSKENHRYQKLRIITFLIGFFVILFSETTSRLVSKNLLENILLFSIPFFLTISLYLFLLFKFNKIKKI